MSITNSNQTYMFLQPRLLQALCIAFGFLFEVTATTTTATATATTIAILV